MSVCLNAPVEDLAAAYQSARARTAEIFQWVRLEAYLDRPIPLRHPIVFYEGHIPAFAWNTLFRRILNGPSFNPDFDSLFARGIDPADQVKADALAIHAWPTRDDIQNYATQIWVQFDAFLAQPDKPGHPLLKNDTIFHLLLEHEWMHQETLMYILNRLAHDRKSLPTDFLPIPKTVSKKTDMITIPAGVARLGATHDTRFGWDNEYPPQQVPVPAFKIETQLVTNGDFLTFIDAGGYDNSAWWTPETWAWKSRADISHPPYWTRENGDWWLINPFEDVRLPLDCPVYVTHAEAKAYAAFVGKSLPTEAEWDRAVYGDSDDLYPWGNTPPDARHGNFGFYYGQPTPVGAFPAGRSQTGLEDTLGNGWEWTDTPFAPFPGFVASEGYPQYSVDFFDGCHFVMKGGGPFTDTRMLRRSFRNWFYWDYPHMHATFRCVTRP